MFFRLFILFTAIPLVELYLLLKLGHIIGIFNTIALVLITGMVGAWMAKSQGLALLRHIQYEMQQGRMPSDSLVEGLLLLVGGVLLLTPGLLTDLAGLLLLFPPTRKLIKIYVTKYFQHRIYIQSI